MKTYQKTISGKNIRFTKPSVFDIIIEDIAHSLANSVRFVGHVHSHYSIAEHSINVANMIRQMGYQKDIQLCGLLHDATEYVLSDISTGLKALLPEYKKLENVWWNSISLRFNLPEVMPGVIKDVDKFYLKIEIEKYQKNKTKALTPKKAKRLFLEKYYELTGICK